MQLVQRVARVAESTVNRHFLSVDGTLAGLSPVLGQIARDGAIDRGAASRMLRDLNFQNLNFRDIIVLRADGRPWASALAGSRNRPSPVDPARLAEARNNGAAVISGPVRNTLTGEWTLFFLRSLDLPGAEPLVVAAEVPVSLLATMLAPLGEVPGLRLSVERADGQLLASLPHDETRIGRPLPRSATSAAAGRHARPRCPAAWPRCRSSPRRGRCSTATSWWSRASRSRPPMRPMNRTTAAC